MFRGLELTLVVLSCLSSGCGDADTSTVDAGSCPTVRPVDGTRCPQVGLECRSSCAPAGEATIWIATCTARSDGAQWDSYSMLCHK